MDIAGLVRAAAARTTDGTRRSSAFLSRARLARDVEGMRFPNRALPRELSEILALGRELQRQLSAIEPAHLLLMRDLSELEREALVEAHLISRRLLVAHENGAVVVTESARVSVMLNEEDHFRIQASAPGLDLGTAHSLAAETAERVARLARMAQLAPLGFLTACPTNAGTGLRASVMLRLPALFFSKRIESSLRQRVPDDMVVRGIYGEGSEPIACFLQVSNQATAQSTAETIVQDVRRTASSIADEEERVVADLAKRYTWELHDLVYRAAAALLSARMIGSIEAMDRLSHVRMGLDLGLLSGATPSTVDQLMVTVRPAAIQVLLGETLAARERDARRAALIRQNLQGLTEAGGL